MRMDSEAWKPLKRERPELLMPMELFGTRAGWRKLEAGGEAAMHATWSVRIAPAVRAIHAYWLPYRRAALAMPEMRSDTDALWRRAGLPGIAGDSGR